MLWPAALVAVASLTFAAGCDGGSASFMSKKEGGSTAKRFFSPSEEDIVKDEDTGLDIIKNVISVTFTPNTSEDTIKKIVSSINGEIVGYDKAVNFYQIRVPNADLQELDRIRMKLLSEHKEVEMASRCAVSVHKNPYYVK